MDTNRTTVHTLEQDITLSSRHWWIFMVISVLSVGLGIWLFFTPIEGFAALSIVFAINFTAISIGQLVLTIRNRHLLPLWGLHLALNLLILAVAMIMLFNLNLSMNILVYYVAFFILFTGINAIILAISAKLDGWQWDLALGILTVIASFILMLYPQITALALTTLTGIAFMITGVTAAVMAYRFYKQGHQPAA